MAGVPPIPPLVCNTPPPIDFGDDEDDSGLPATLTLDDDDDFGDFALAIETNEDSTNADVSSLPRTPLQYELSSSTTSGFTDVPPVLEEYITVSPAPPLPTEMPGREVKCVNNNTVTQPNEAYNYKVVANLQSNVFKPTIDKVMQPKSDIECESSTPIATTANAEAFSNPMDNKLANSSVEEINVKSEIASPAVREPASTLASADISRANEVEHGTDNDTQALADEIVTQDPNSDIVVTQKQQAHAAILLEDLADDSSDDECHRSPKKLVIQSTNVDEDSEDFFAIHMVENEAAMDPTNEEISAKTEDFEEINSNSYANINSDNTADANSFDSADFNDVTNFNADFSQFADFKSHSPVTETIPTEGTKTEQNFENAKEESNNEVDAGNDDDDDDDFDDFQDFTSAAINITPPVTETSASPPTFSKQMQVGTEAAQVNAVEECVDDDDDFGDFEEASFAAPVTNTSNTTDNAPQVHINPQEVTTPQPPITPDTKNLQERLNSLLKMMFPTSEAPNVDDSKELNTKQQSSTDALPLESVEAAKALEFQWPNSEIRHALIRAIGIDSRNILFGENWNPTMPRFAANLSFNPLKPMKPLSASTSSGNTMPSGIEIETPTYSSSGNMDNMAYITKSDVPEVEFDWQSAGLVNPLEGLKGDANTRETETIYAPPPGQSNASDDKHQSCSAYANLNDHFSETLSKDSDLSTTNTNTTTTSTIANANAKDQQCTPHKTLPLDSVYTLAQESDCKVLESNAKRTLTPLHFGAGIDELEDETVATSTYAGPLKETHIYTPSKSELAAAKSKTVSCSEPIDFDYEIAAAGIIIDETVVKKEYRDVEYNPGFSLEPSNMYTEQIAVNVSAVVNPSAVPATFPCVTIEPIETPTVTPIPTAQHDTNYDCDEFTEFTEFQSVPPPLVPLPTLNSSTNATSGSARALPTSFNMESTSVAITTVSVVPSPVPLAVTKTKEHSRTPSRTSSPSIIDNMILSPAILLPQAIPISANSTTPTPTIEWGNSAATINPEELARIEELFPQPKISAINDARKESNSSQKSSPAHAQSGDGKRTEKQEHNSLSISATVAQKEQESLNDDYWSDFVSVTVPQADANTIKNNNNNNHLLQTPKRQAVINAANINANMNINANIHSQTISSPLQHNKNFATIKTAAAAQHRAHAVPDSSANNCNDDDWSDFVSSTPASTHASATPATAHNYMSVARAHTMTPQFNSAAWQNANFYNNPIGLYHQAQHRTLTTAPQQIHIMQDFSTMPASRPQVANMMHNATHNGRNNISGAQHAHSNHTLQVGSARVAPSISLIPDLGFVAPAMPVHTAFINVLPKPSFNSKK